MSREIVEWLRDYARRCEQTSLVHAQNRGEEPLSSYEAHLALKFADMIEQRFVPSVADLASAPSSFPPIPIYAATGKFRRRRRGTVVPGN